MGIKISSKGDWSKTEKFFKSIQDQGYLKVLRPFAEKGVDALSKATPQDSGLTARCWSYEIEKTPEGASIYFLNSNMNKGVSVAIILQYGHGTRNGGYVRGRDYINSAIRPIFDDIAEAAWKEIVK